MSTRTAEDRKSFLQAVEELKPGDCLQVESFAGAAGSARELLAAIGKIAERGADFVSLREELDTREERDARFFAICRAFAALDRAAQREKQRDGIEKAREEGKYKGRKPIAVDEGLFEEIVSRWRNGEISARQAMSALELKPNTFYRRIKEREEQKMKDYKKAEQEIRAELKEAAKQSRRDLDELKKQVQAEAREVKRNAEEHLELHDVEREMRRDRRRAEAEHEDAVKQLKKDVQAEAKELKQMISEKE